MQRVAVAIVLIVAIAVAAGTPDDEARAAPANAVAQWCVSGDDVTVLNRMFDPYHRMVGVDYPRSLALPDDRVLWTFQDPIVLGAGDSLRNLHNAGVVQTDNCFEFLRTGTESEPRPWLLGDLTVNERAWFWPLDMTLSVDGRTVSVFLAQMFEDDDDVYLDRAVPNSVVVVTLDATTLAVTGGPFTPDWGVLTPSDRTLYGWSAERAGNYTYLFGHCHRQFGFDPFFDGFSHDRSCTAEIRLARVPRGDVFAPPEYWTGSRWSTDRNAARPLLEPDRVSISQPTQFQYVNGSWLAVTKVDDWWGQFVLIDEAVKVTGPWRPRPTRWVAPKCSSDECNTYFSSFVDDPGRARTDPVMISLSHNRWDGIPRSEVYRPTYFEIDPPTSWLAVGDRCELDQC